MTKKTIDPVFAEYTRTAPLEDLRFYLRYAERRLMTLDLSDSTVTIVREMLALERELLGGVPTPAAKARVWTLIPRFRSSIPGWAGSAGEKGSWVEPVDSDDTYWRARRALTMLEIVEPAAVEPLPVADAPVIVNGRPRPAHRKKTPEQAPEPVVRSVETEGPVTLEQVVVWHQPARDEAARLSGFGVPRRVDPLTLDAVRALLAEGLPERPVAAQATKPARARQQPAPVAVVPVVPERQRVTLTCPSCSHALRPVCGHTLQCEGCSQTFHLTLYARERKSPCRACQRRIKAA